MIEPRVELVGKCDFKSLAKLLNPVTLLFEEKGRG
jgi:hypothetical protein